MGTQFALMLTLVAGLALILGGANYLTDGSASIARRLNVSGFIIGLTIVALGTSMPEMVVSIVSAMRGESAISIGNVVGSNTFNTLVILGMCSLFAPLALTKGNVRRDIPMGIAASAMMAVVAWGGVIGRAEGIVMLALYLSMIWYSIHRSNRDKLSMERMEVEQKADKEADTFTEISMGVAIIMTVGGLAALIYGGQLFIDSAVRVAYIYGIPDNVIALTLVAGGTSLPEFAASFISLLKGKSDIALGNVIGSNIANILLVLGCSSTLTPLTMGSITMLDIAVVVASSALLLLWAILPKRNQIGRIEGAIMIAIYIFYIANAINK